MGKQRKKLIDEIKSLELKMPEPMSRVLEEDRKLMYFSKNELKSYKFLLQITITNPREKSIRRRN